MSQVGRRRPQRGDNADSIWAAFVQRLYRPDGAVDLSCTDGSVIRLTTSSMFQEVFGGRKHIVATMPCGQRFDIVAKLTLLTNEDSMRTLIRLCLNSDGYLSRANAMMVFSVLNELSLAKMMEAEAVDCRFAPQDEMFLQRILAGVDGEDDLLADPISAAAGILAQNQAQAKKNLRQNQGGG